MKKYLITSLFSLLLIAACSSVRSIKPIEEKKLKFENQKSYVIFGVVTYKSDWLKELNNAGDQEQFVTGESQQAFNLKLELNNAFYYVFEVTPGTHVKIIKAVAQDAYANINNPKDLYIPGPGIYYYGTYAPFGSRLIFKESNKEKIAEFLKNKFGVQLAD